MDLQFWAATDVGRCREHNEDNFLVDKRLSLFVVCDGMGGHAAGEVASAIAVRAIREVVANNRTIIDRNTQDPANPSLRKELLKLLEHAVQEACTRIYDMAQQNPDRRGMGTTCSLLLLVGRRSFIAHVGDSRIYLLRRGQVHQLTEDHSLANEMKRRGRTSDNSLSAQYKNAITRAVGVYESVEVDTLDMDNLPGDRFLLCSDGLSMYLDNDGIKAHLAAKADGPTSRAELKKIVADLITYGNDQGGKDNITAVLIGVNESQDEAPVDDDIRLTIETMRNIPLFQYLNYKELVRIINVTEKERVDQGTCVVRQGEVGDRLYVIMRGEFVVERDGQELARLSGGRHFGEMALVDERPRSASVRCVQEGTVLTIQRPAFYELLRKDPAMAVKLLWNFIQTLSARLRDAPLPRGGEPQPLFPPPHLQVVDGESDTLDEIEAIPDIGSEHTLPPGPSSRPLMGGRLPGASTAPPLASPRPGDPLPVLNPALSTTLPPKPKAAPQKRVIDAFAQTLSPADNIRVSRRRHSFDAATATEAAIDTTPPGGVQQLSRPNVGSPMSEGVDVFRRTAPLPTPSRPAVRPATDPVDPTHLTRSSSMARLDRSQDMPAAPKARPRHTDDDPESKDTQH